MVVLLGAWALAAALMCASSMVGHLLPLPRSEAARVPAGLASLEPGGAPASLVAFHVLDSKCRCSRRVVDGLVSRHPLAGVVERVVLVDDDEAIRTRLLGAGFSVTTVPASELESRFAIQGAPVLLVASRDGRLVYEGGYTTNKQGFVLEDKRIIQESEAGRAPAPLPVFGCAVTSKLRRERNPLRIPWSDR